MGTVKQTHSDASQGIKTSLDAKVCKVLAGILEKAEGCSFQNEELCYMGCF